MDDPPLVMYSTVGCHLCEEAQFLCMQVLGQTVPEIDIVTDEALLERYSIRIPVLQRKDNDAELDWPFDKNAMMAFLKDK